MANGTKDEDDSIDAIDSSSSCESNSNSTSSSSYHKKPGPLSSPSDIAEVPSHVFVIEGCPVVEAEKGNYHNHKTAAAVLAAPSTPISMKTKDAKFSLASLSTEAGGTNVVSPSQNQRGFNIRTLRDCLEACLRERNGGLDLDSYLDAYREICKLLDNLGTVIRANIGKDIKQKIGLMRSFRAGPNASFYKTIEKMVTFEKIKKIPQTNPEENGSRTILILHRSLKFVFEFLRSLNALKSDQGLSSVAKEVYNRTLAPYHPWAYRHIARVAFSTLGKKGQLVANFHDGNMTPAQLQEIMERVVYVASQVFIRCQAIYEKNNFLDLP